MSTFQQPEQWWLATLDRYGNVTKFVDGSHPQASGAHKAYYLHERLGMLRPDVQYAVVQCKLHQPIADSSTANEEALDTLNAIGLKPKVPHMPGSCRRCGKPTFGPLCGKCKGE